MAAYLLTPGAGRFEEIGGAPVVDRLGRRDADRFYILKDTWCQIHHGHEPTVAAKHLHAAGWLIPDTDGKNLMRKAPRVFEEPPASSSV